MAEVASTQAASNLPGDSLPFSGTLPVSETETASLVIADDDPRGELVELLHDLRQPQMIDHPQRPQKEERLRKLLAQGTQPCQPRDRNSISMEFVLVPPGTFLMGSLPDEPGRCDDEIKQQGLFAGGSADAGRVDVALWHSAWHGY
jgi:hypothetical protein